ncbi:MAG: nucleotidyltransferase substrate binding protein [Deltaproteobacteria bacterium]|nr:nucleotidyltransferase substrate binding protein [Deltaproteobacteria bacterium]
MIDYDRFNKSLHHLDLQYKNYKNSGCRQNLTELDKEALAESVIHRFETCYDMLWKHLKRYIVEELGLVDVPNSPKPVFRLAAENKLLSSQVDQWLNKNR